MESKRPIAIACLLCLQLFAGCAQNRGECDPACATGLECCGGFCVDLHTDPHNCGSCGSDCGSDSICRGGLCVELCGGVECPTGTTCCEETCTDTGDDPLNCGACGTACGSDQDCIDGTCTTVECDPPCGTDESCCAIPGGDPVCANLSIDDDHCGACRHECPAGESCSTGVCTSTPCDPPDCGGEPNRCCSGTCVDTDTSFDNCGFCGHACDADAADACSGGVCQCNSAPACHTGQKCCPELGCRNVSTDVNNCGDCGVVCDPGWTCTDGVCNCGGEVCREGYGCCSGTCRDIMWDSTNCGACGHACGANGWACIEGSCMCGTEDPPCHVCTFVECTSILPPGPYDTCQLCCPLRGGCVPNSDENCGACGNACTGGSRCEPVEVGMSCTFQCVGGITDASTDGDI